MGLGIAQHGDADRTEIAKRRNEAQQPHRDADTGGDDAKPSGRIHRPWPRAERRRDHREGRAAKAVSLSP